MMVLLVALTGVLALVVLGLSVLALRLARRVERLEAHASERPLRASVEPPETAASGSASRGRPARIVPQEYLITRVGESTVEDSTVDERPAEPAPTVPAALFADLVARETVVRTASLIHGLRRALEPQTRNRIRFEVRREIKRSRKQRRADLRAARREWEARQRQNLDEPFDDRVSAA